MEVGSEAAEIASEMNPRLGDEGRELLDEFQAREEEMARAVGVFRFEFQDDIARGPEFEPFLGNGRAGDVAAEFFEFISFPGRANRRRRGARTRR